MKKLLATLVLPIAALACGGEMSTSDRLDAIRNGKARLTASLDQLQALARAGHLTNWQSHAMKLDEAKSLMNSIGCALEALPQGDATRARLVLELAPSAAGIESLIARLRENRLVIQRASYYDEVTRVAREVRERKQRVIEAIQMALAGSPARNGA
ncbi:MAG TPA: hypothetical protein DEH78_33415 [Solibacterales bacterium]|nr:hypothetical protein [Bryobacterales bacterium]